MQIYVPLSKLDDNVITPFMFGGVINGTDQAAVFQRMAASSATVWYIPANTSWRIDSLITISHDLIITGTGTLDFSQGNGGVLITGSLTQISDLSLDVPKRSSVLSFTSTPDISNNDIIILYNPTDFSWSNHRSYYREGEMVRVYSVSDNNVTIFGDTNDSYLAVDMDVYRLNGVKGIIRDIHVIPSANSNVPAIEIRNGIDCVFEDVRGAGGIYTVLALTRCYGFNIRGNNVINSSVVSGDEYGIAISNCQKGSIDGFTGHATRHCIALGGGSGPGCVPTRGLKISNCILQNLKSSGVGSADMHGNTDNITYHNCIISHANIAGRNNSYIDCTIYGRGNLDDPVYSDGACIWGGEIVGGFFKIHGCKLISEGNGQTYGYVYLAFSQYTGEDGLREDFHLDVDNITFIVPNATSLSKLIWLEVNGLETKKVSVRVGRVNVLETTQSMVAILSIRDIASTATLKSDYLIVDGPIDAPSGTYLILPHSSSTNVPKRLMPQHVSTTVTCTNGNTSATSSSIGFRYPYPKIPDCHSVSIGSTDGFSKSTWGGRGLSSFCNTRSSTSATLGVTAIGGNFSSTEDVRLTGVFGINEI